MKKIYDNLKIFKTRSFKTKNEENEYFIRIQEENIFEYRESLLEKFEDYYHVMWSRKFVSIISSFLFLGLSIICANISIISTCLLTTSLLSLLLSKYYQKLLNKKVSEESFVMHFLNKHIEDDYGVVFE